MNISVFITSYNQFNYLREAIESVMGQTLPANQIIVVDDASSDDSPDLIADYTRRYPDLFTPIYHKYNTGIAQVRIDALKSVRGDYVTYVDGDDWFLPEKLEKEAKTLSANPETGIAFSNNDYVSEDGSQIIWRWVDNESVPQGNVFGQTFGRSFPRRNLFRMELVDYHAWEKIGFHDPVLRLYEDFDMRIRLTWQLKVVYVDQVLSRIRVHENGLSKSKKEMHMDALHYIYMKNKKLCNSLPKKLRLQALHHLAIWIAQIGFMATKNSRKEGQIAKTVHLMCRALSYQGRGMAYNYLLNLRS